MTAPPSSHKSLTVGGGSGGGNGMLHQRTYSQCQDSQTDLFHGQ